MTRELENRVALVTGSSRGIGAAIAGHFAAAGATTAVHGRDVAALLAVRTQIENDGGRAIAVAADLTRAEEVEAMVAAIERELGPVDVLVANAGLVHRRGIGRVELPDGHAPHRPMGGAYQQGT